MMEAVLEQVNQLLDGQKETMRRLGIVLQPDDLIKIAGTLLLDLEARMKQDPVSTSVALVFCSNAFKAICVYRVANYICSHHRHASDNNLLFAYQISEETAARTSIEIHPSARIGHSFVIDHGIHTIIGATAEVGDHCTLLHNVLLGARRITNNKEGKRHPTLGNHVQVASGVSILGPVNIGNHVMIGPGCTISKDVPDNSFIKLKKSMLILNSGTSQIF